jgi:plastocyanin
MRLRIPLRTAMITGGAIAALGAAVVPAVVAKPTSAPAVAATAKKVTVKTVMVLDDYYKPDKLTVKPGTQIKWVWSNNNYDTHNVTLKSGPKGVKRSKFSSIDGTSGLVFKRTLTVPGTYHFYCTIHPAMMTMTIVVKR